MQYPNHSVIYTKVTKYHCYSFIYVTLQFLMISSLIMGYSYFLSFLRRYIFIIIDF